MDNFVTVTEAAKVLGITPHGVRSRIARGELQASQVSPKLWLIPAEEVERAKAAGRMKPGPKPKQAAG